MFADLISFEKEKLVIESKDGGSYTVILNKKIAQYIQYNPMDGIFRTKILDKNSLLLYKKEPKQALIKY